MKVNLQTVIARSVVPGFICAAVISILVITTAHAEETTADDRPRGHFGVGAGLGVRNGFGGVCVEASPVEYVAFTAGAGFVGLAAYSFGAQVFPAGRSWKVRPWISIAGGQAAAFFEDFSYVAFGLGGEVGFNPRHTLDFGLDVVKGNDEAFVFPSVGWRFHF